MQLCKGKRPPQLIKRSLCNQGGCCSAQHNPDCLAKSTHHQTHASCRYITIWYAAAQDVCAVCKKPAYTSTPVCCCCHRSILVPLWTWPGPLMATHSLQLQAMTRCL
jgi:hypothetical protein